MMEVDFHAVLMALICAASIVLLVAAATAEDRE